MIKKLFSVVLFTTSVGVASSFAQATSCTADVSCVPNTEDFGICPDSATGIPASSVGTPYSVNMSIKIPGTQVQGGLTVTVTHLALTDVLVDTSTSGTPVWVDLTAIGLDYLGALPGANSPQGGASGISGYTMTKYCYWSAPNATGVCVKVSGTPTKGGTFPIKIKSRARVGSFGAYFWTQDSSTGTSGVVPDNDDYVLNVSGVAGIEVLNANKFDVMQNSPNPFNEKTVINFSSPNVSDVDFKVYNMVGAVVYSENLKADKGVNNITLKANSFAPGVYMYAVKNGSQTITKRMVVTQ